MRLAKKQGRWIQALLVGFCEERARAQPLSDQVYKAVQAVAALIPRSRLTQSQVKTKGALSLSLWIVVALRLEDGGRTGDGHDIDAIFRVVQGDRINDAPGQVWGWSVPCSVGALEADPSPVAVLVPEKTGLGEKKRPLELRVILKQCSTTAFVLGAPFGIPPWH